MTTSTAFPQDRVARGTAIQTIYEQPENVAPAGRPVEIFAYGVPQYDKSIAATPFEFVSLSDTADKVGRQSPLYHIAEMIKPQFGTQFGGKLTLFPLEVGGTPAQAAGDVTPSGTATETETHYVKVNNRYSKKIELAVGDSVAEWIAKAITAVNAVINMPVTASDGTTTLDLTAGFETDAGDFLYVEIEKPATSAFSFTITQPTGGAGTVDIATAWAVFNDNWHSHVINGIDDATGSATLNSAQTFGDARWGATVRKPFKHYTGSNEATAATIRAITDARTSDKINSIKWNPASNDLPWVIAAAMVKEQAILASADPAKDYQLKRVPSLTVGTASAQLDSDARDLAVKDGLSTIEVYPDGVYISDSVMCYHPAGEEPPGFRYDVDIEKECYMLKALDNIFSNPADAGAPTVPNDQVTTNPNVRKASYYKKKIDTLYDNAALAAIISDPAWAKERSSVTPSSTNPNRFDVQAVYKLSGINSVISMDNRFSFNVGG